MPESAPRTDLEQDVCVHVFTVSAGMVGVCLTVIGLVCIVAAFRKIDSRADELLAADALLFLISCLSAYWALRTRNARRLHRVERAADAVFILAMVLMVCICGVITFAIASV